jgi:hypothetical protein
LTEPTTESPPAEVSPAKADAATISHSADALSSHAVVLVLIAVVATLFLSMVGVIYYYSSWKIFRDPRPSALLVVVGDERLDGAVVQVQGVASPPVRHTLSAQNGYMCRMPLMSGRYALKIELDGTIILMHPYVNLRDGQYQVVSPLPREELVDTAG